MYDQSLMNHVIQKSFSYQGYDTNHPNGHDELAPELLRQRWHILRHTELEGVGDRGAGIPDQNVPEKDERGRPGAQQFVLESPEAPPTLKEEI